MANILFCDLAYWHRLKDDRAPAGHHRFVLNGLHTAEETLLRARRDDGVRLKSLGVEPVEEPHSVRNKTVLIAGMSEKGARVWGYGPEEWEEQAAREAEYHGMSVIYRPKPSWKGSTRLRGRRISINEPIETALGRVQAVICHHSNVGVDCLVHGVPYFTVRGVAKRLSAPSISALPDWRPAPYKDRLTLLQQISWQQFSTHELRTGYALRHLLPGLTG